MEGENHVQVHIFVPNTQTDKEEADPQTTTTSQSKELLAQQEH
jgi:hypothetical protein